MRGYFKVRVLAVEVSDKPLDNGSYFVNVTFFGEGSREVNSGWCYSTDPVFDTLSAIDPETAPLVGMTARVSVKQPKQEGWKATQSVAVEAIYLLDANGNPTGEVAESKARRNGRLVASS